MSSGPRSAVDPATVAVLAALETSTVATTVVASAAITVTSADNDNQLSAGDVASSLTVMSSKRQGPRPAPSSPEPQKHHCVTILKELNGH
jgi:hypothetical protein